MDYPRSLPETLTLIDEQQARIEALESLLGTDQLMVLQRKFNLAPQTAKILSVLANGQPRTREQLISALDTGHADWAPHAKLLDVLLFRLRKEIWPFGFTVRTLWGVGFWLEGPLPLLAGDLDAPIVRGAYVPNDSGRNLPFEKTKAGLILAYFRAEFTQDAPFPVSPLALSRALDISPQSAYAAVKRLGDLGYVKRMRKGSGWVPAVYRFTKNQKEKAA